MKNLNIVYISFYITFNIKDLTYAQGDIGVGNLRNFYTKHDYIDLKGVTDKSLPIANQLEFSTGTNDLISESNNWDEISKFKGKKLPGYFWRDYNGHMKSKYHVWRGHFIRTILKFC